MDYFDLPIKTRLPKTTLESIAMLFHHTFNDMLAILTSFTCYTREGGSTGQAATALTAVVGSALQQAMRGK